MTTWRTEPSPQCGWRRRRILEKKELLHKADVFFFRNYHRCRRPLPLWLALSPFPDQQASSWTQVKRNLSNNLLYSKREESSNMPRHPLVYGDLNSFHLNLRQKCKTRATKKTLLEDSFYIVWERGEHVRGQFCIIVFCCPLPGLPLFHKRKVMQNAKFSHPILSPRHRLPL